MNTTLMPPKISVADLTLEQRDALMADLLLAKFQDARFLPFTVRRGDTEMGMFFPAPQPTAASTVADFAPEFIEEISRLTQEVVAGKVDLLTEEECLNLLLKELDQTHRELHPSLRQGRATD